MPAPATFAELRASVLAYAARAPDLDAATITYGLIGELETWRREVSRDFVSRQLPDGFHETAAARVNVFQSPARVAHDLFIGQRSFLVRCVHLGIAPPRRLAYLDNLLRSREALVEWLDELPWREPWKVGNLDMDTAYAIAIEALLRDDPRAHAAMETWFEWHDRHIDPETGFWDPARTGDRRACMAGAMHQYGLYFLYGREVPHAERAVAATLALQCPTGLFAPDTFSYNCLDVDAVYMIANLATRHLCHEAAVRTCLERVHEANLRCFHPEGGGVNRLGQDKDADWWSTYCRVAIVGWCARLLGLREYDGPWDWRTRHPFQCADAGASVSRLGGAPSALLAAQGWRE